MGRHIPGVFLKHLLKFSNGFDKLPGVGQSDGAAVATVFAQPVLGIGTGNSARSSAAQISEGAEARNYFRASRRLSLPAIVVWKR